MRESLRGKVGKRGKKRGNTSAVLHHSPHTPTLYFSFLILKTISMVDSLVRGWGRRERAYNLSGAQTEFNTPEQCAVGLRPTGRVRLALEMTSVYSLQH